jgi:hypothetical protein
MVKNYMSELINKTSMYLVFDYISNDGSNTKKTIKREIGSSENQIDFSLIRRIIELSKSNSSSDKESFTDYLAKEVYSSLSESEKALVQTIIKDTKSISSVQIVMQENTQSVTEYDVRVGGLPTDEYLRDLKLSEEYDFKIRENNKYRKKMEKISGNMPLDELMIDINGTSFKPSNMHETDWSRLNDHKINSPAFN